MTELTLLQKLKLKIFDLPPSLKLVNVKWGLCQSHSSAGVTKKMRNLPHKNDKTYKTINITWFQHPGHILKIYRKKYQWPAIITNVFQRIIVSSQ